MGLKIQVCDQRTESTIQSHKAISKRQIRMFRLTDMDPQKGVIRRPRIVSITWSACSAHDAHQPEQKKGSVGQRACPGFQKVCYGLSMANALEIILETAML